MPSYVRISFGVLSAVLPRLHPRRLPIHQNPRRGKQRTDVPLTEDETSTVTKLKELTGLSVYFGAISGVGIQNLTEIPMKHLSYGFLQMFQIYPNLYENERLWILHRILLFMWDK